MSVSIKHSTWQNKKGFYPFIKEMLPRKPRKASADEKDLIPAHDYRIQRVGNRYYLLIRKDVIPTTPDAIDSPRSSVISLDPGVRAFMTEYSPRGVVVYGDGCDTRLTPILASIDAVQARKASIGDLRPSEFDFRCKQNLFRVRHKKRT